MRSRIVDTTPLQTGPARKVVIMVNTGLTGTITVEDTAGAATSTIAVITNPVAGNRFEYWDLVRGTKVTASGACDITVNQQ